MIRIWRRLIVSFSTLIRVEILLTCLLVLSATRNTAAITLVTNESAFDAAYPGLSVHGFGGIAAAGSFVSSVNGATLVPNAIISAQDLDVVSATFTNLNFPGSPSDFLLVDRLAAGMQINFAPKIQAVGMRIALSQLLAPDPGGPVTLELFDGSTQLFSQLVSASSIGSFSTFFGLKDFGEADRLQILNPSNQFTVAIDDLRFSQVPEPNGFLLVTIAATFQLMCCLRQRQAG